MPIISVLPDVPALDRAFDYVHETSLQPGTVVRVPLGARRVRGWVLGVRELPETGTDRDLLAVSKVVGRGPTEEVIDLCRWSAWRWAGRLVTMMRLATPERVVSLGRATGRSGRWRAMTGGGLADVSAGTDPALADLVRSILRSGPGASVLRTTPLTDPLDLVVGAVGSGPTIVVTPSPADADRISARLRSAGVRVARWPQDWLGATEAEIVVGTRSVVFAPTSRIAGIIVLDEHDRLLQSESSPTWNAREVAVERARRLEIPALLVSPCPSLESFRAQQGGQLLDPGVPDVLAAAFTLSRSATRSGWSGVRVIDRRGEDVRRSGLFSSELVSSMRDAVEEGRHVTCVLNRTGRARLLACRSCSSLVRCHECGSAMAQLDDSTLACPACGARRPAVCAECGSSALALVRPGITRAREDLEALLRVPVEQVTAGQDVSHARRIGPMVRIGTTAALSTPTPGGLVAFVDFDQELMARRYRAAEDALSLIVMASRSVGGRHGGGSMIIQTLLPEHEVLLAAVRADPSVVSRSEVRRRSLLGLPPVGAVAWVAGEAGEGFVTNLGRPEGVTVSSAGDGEWLIGSRSPGRLQDALADVVRPPGRLRLQVDPHRLGR